MAAKGNIAKEQIRNKILETFKGSFLYDNGKEIRIPIMEEGSLVQIKVTLTCAKVNVAEGEDNAIPGAVINSPHEVNFEDMATTPPAAQEVTVTAEEKENIAKMLSALGL